jgi:hypothetical protein
MSRPGVLERRNSRKLGGKAVALIYFHVVSHGTSSSSMSDSSSVSLR